MSFIDIKDPKKRDAIVADYLATVKRIQQRNLNEKAQDLTRQDYLQKMFSLVVESTEKSTKAITEELASMRLEIKNLNENVLHQITAERRQQKQAVKGRREIDEESQLNVVVVRQQLRVTLTKYTDGCFFSFYDNIRLSRNLFFVTPKSLGNFFL